MKQIDPSGPFLLAIETATSIGSIAIFSGADLLAGREIRMARSHARLLTPMIQGMLEDLELKPADLSAIAVAKGPGSYTGLRVGVSTAKGLCMALNKPLLAVDSLSALAMQVQALARQLDAWICPMLDARRMEVFCALFDANIQIQHPIEAKIMEEGAFEAVLAKRKVIFLGDGSAKCADILRPNPNAIILSESLSSANYMGKALFDKFQKQDFEDLIRFEPYYLKDFVATKSKKWKINTGAN